MGIFKEVFGSADALLPVMLYSISVTIIAVILTILVARKLSKMKELMK